MSVAPTIFPVFDGGMVTGPTIKYNNVYTDQFLYATQAPAQPPTWLPVCRSTKRKGVAFGSFAKPEPALITRRTGNDVVAPSAKKRENIFLGIDSSATDCRVLVQRERDHPSRCESGIPCSQVAVFWGGDDRPP